MWDMKSGLLRRIVSLVPRGSSPRSKCHIRNHLALHEGIVSVVTEESSPNYKIIVGGSRIHPRSDECLHY